MCVIFANFFFKVDQIHLFVRLCTKIRHSFMIINFINLRSNGLLLPFLVTDVKMTDRTCIFQKTL